MRTHVGLKLGRGHEAELCVRGDGAHSVEGLRCDVFGCDKGELVQRSWQGAMTTPNRYQDVEFRRGIYRWASPATADGRVGEAAVGGGSCEQPPTAETVPALAAAAPGGSPRHSEDGGVCRLLQLLFADLQHFVCVAFYPADLVKALGINPKVKEDAPETRGMLLERLEKRCSSSG